MIIAIDVHYRETHAVAAAVLFDEWFDAAPLSEATTLIRDVAEYVPGQFYRRELPCIQAILAQQTSPLTTIVIDGYVDLGPEKKPGLGKYLWEELNGAIPVIGVAKNAFKGSPTEIEVRRGMSRKPLYVTAAGVELSVAKQQIASMHGPYRIPTLLKHVDALCRQV